MRDHRYQWERARDQRNQRETRGRETRGGEREQRRKGREESYLFIFVLLGTPPLSYPASPLQIQTNGNSFYLQKTEIIGIFHHILKAKQKINWTCLLLLEHKTIQMLQVIVT